MQRKIPMRQCMGCRERKPKRELDPRRPVAGGRVSVWISRARLPDGAPTCAPGPELP